nr:putative integron gene cassette protein [uncultured bacterium]
MPKGAFRRVILIGSWAIKFPRFKNIANGLRCNRWEREVWIRWRPIFGWDGLCPILAADPLGLIVIMARAKQPVSAEEADASIQDDRPAIWRELKPQDYGRIGDKVVVLDYGIPFLDMVTHERRYLLEVAKQLGGG